MSVPSRKPLLAQNFFGKSYPRAIGALADNDELVIANNKARLPNAPFLEWAGTADWRRGGTGSHWVGKPPKEPLTPFEAYELYLDSQDAKAVAEAAQRKDDTKQEPDCHKETAEVLEDAERNWKALAPNERAIFEELARDDAKRFQEQATAFEMANPGWFERRHKWKAQRRAPGAKRAGHKRAKSGAKRPRPALTPWKAFLKVILEKVKRRDPEAAASLKAAELLRLATEQAGPIWEKLADDDKAEYISMAEEDEARYERELEVYRKAEAANNEQRAPGRIPRALSATKEGKPRSRKTRAKDAAAAAADGAKPEGARNRRKQRKPVRAETAAMAKEAAEKVDVTGLTPMQAWAKKQRALRNSGAAPKRVTCAARKQASAARRESLEEAAAAARAPAATASTVAAASDGVPSPHERGTAADAELRHQSAQDCELRDEALLPNQAHIRSRATLDDGEESSEEEDQKAEEDNISISSSSSGGGSSESDADKKEEEEQAGSEELTQHVLDLAPDEGPSQVPDTEPRASQGKGSVEVGMLGRMRSALADGLGWLTTGRERRGVMASMQDAPLELQTAERPRRGAGPPAAAGSPATAAKKRATPRRLDALYDFDKITFDEAPPSSAAKRRRRAS